MHINGRSVTQECDQTSTFMTHELTAVYKDRVILKLHIFAVSNDMNTTRSLKQIDSTSSVNDN